ncbi:MAG TPA: hypothetical protein G4N91_01060 [Dehalococcoidia bacterium]|nr:hypothetical protein [Dehalococcoidia bacterium]
MSKFIDKLILASQGEKPMGFRAAATGASPKPGMLLVALVATSAARTAGADAVLFSVPKTGAKSPKLDVPWGGWLKAVTTSGVKQLGEGGADFVVFPAESVSSAILEDDKLGKILEVEPGLDLGLLKAVDDLPVDAVLIAGEKPSLTWQDLMLFRRCASISSKPLLVSVPSEVAASELQALWQAGVVGVVVGAAKTAELRKIIDKLVPPLTGKVRKAEPLVPRISGDSRIKLGEEEEEEDEE